MKSTSFYIVDVTEILILEVAYTLDLAYSSLHCFGVLSIIHRPLQRYYL